jgi:hypothetical protein
MDMELDLLVSVKNIMRRSNDRDFPPGAGRHNQAELLLAQEILPFQIGSRRVK